MLIGSGASVASPSNLALFGDIRTALVTEVNETVQNLHARSDRISARLEAVAPEVAFHSLKLAGVKVAEALVSGFDEARPKPNAVHEVVAHHLAADGLAWTTNYDTLIERAWRASTGETGPPEGLTKPHGTFLDDSGDTRWVGSENLMFERDQVLAPWTDTQVLAFTDACADSGALVVVGYSGMDVNAREAIREALRSVKSVAWYERTSSRDEVLERKTRMALRFPELDLDEVRWSDNPSRRFVVEQRQPGWQIVASPACAVGHHRCDLATFGRAGRDLRVVATLAVDVGEDELKRQVVSSILKTGEASDAAVLWARAERRVDARRFARPLWNLVKPVAARVPNPARSRARSTWLASHGLRSPNRARKVENQLARWLPHAQTPSEHASLQIDRSRALRVMGRYTEAVAAASDAMSVAVIQANEPTKAGQAEMETVESFRVLGRFDEALDAGAGRYHTLGLLHWSGWNAYEIGCTFLQLRRFDEAAVFIAKATAFFAGEIDDATTVYDRRLGHDYSRLAQAALRRLRRDIEGAKAVLSTVGDTKHHTGWGQIDVSRRFQAAEIARALGDLDEARRNYMLMPAWLENYPALSHLGLAYSTGNTDGQQKLLDQAAAESAAQDSIFGIALCSQAAHDLSLQDRVHGASATAARGLRSRIFGITEPDPTRPRAFL